MTESALEPATLHALEYRLDSYAALLRSFRAAGYEFAGFDERPDEKEVLIRHDVDLSVERAVAMAEREHELGVTSTFCFLLTAPAYDLDHPRTTAALGRISELGHEIALHFDPHHYWASPNEPEREAIADTVTDELDILSRLIDEEVSTVSFHVPPEWVLGRSFAEFTNTYAPRFFSEIGYVSDSSQKWTATEPFPDGLDETFQLLVHPGLWHADHRPMADIVETARSHAHTRVDDYFDPLS